MGGRPDRHRVLRLLDGEPRDVARRRLVARIGCEGGADVVGARRFRGRGLGALLVLVVPVRDLARGARPRDLARVGEPLPRVGLRLRLEPYGRRRLPRALGFYRRILPFYKVRFSANNEQRF